MERKDNEKMAEMPEELQRLRQKKQLYEKLMAEEEERKLEEVQNQKLSDMREQINEINKQMKDMKNTQIKLLQIIEEQTRDPPKNIPQKRSSWWY